MCSEEGKPESHAGQATSKQRGILLRLIHTPTDIRGSIGSHAHTVNWLLPPDAEIERKARHAVESITADLVCIGPQDHEMIPSYLDSIEKPLAELKAIGLGLSFAVLSGPITVEGQLMDHWDTTVYVVSERPLAYFSVEDSKPSQMHLLNGCRETERCLIRCKGDGVGVIPKEGFNLGWFDEEQSWCPECWKVVVERRDQLKVSFGGKDTSREMANTQDAKDLLLLQALVAPIMGMTKEVFTEHLNTFSISDEDKHEILETYSQIASASKTEESLEHALELIRNGEGHNVEFKSSFAVPLDFDRTYWVSKGLATQIIDQKFADAEKAVIHSVLKTIAAFVNSSGGVLFLGVRDDGQILGLEPDYQRNPKKPTADGLELKIRAMLKDRLHPAPHTLVKFTPFTHQSKQFFRIDVSPDFEPHHLDEKDLFIRDGNETVQLNGPSLTKWVARRLEQGRHLT